ncbi:MAG: PqqD family protein [Bacteroides sp.]|nr:PqqD family protein [Roseburia sp.]MCM1347498.1 PqqD family protein [Bacteroides sp.]MCM1421641.1 PqqD family protein [Bacteroides sp.]
MKIKQGFELRKICGENIIISYGMENISFTRIITLNESAAMIWENVVCKDFTVTDMANLLLDKYKVDRQTALADSSELIREWEKAGIVCL